MIIQRDKTAIVYKGRNYSYTQLLQLSLRYKEEIEKCANGIELKNILIFSENSPEYIFTIYAILRIGAVVVPVDVTSTEKELKYIIKDNLPQVIFVSSDKYEFMTDVVKLIENYSPVILVLEDVDVSGVEKMPIVEIPLKTDDTPVSIIYTSGTTGSPKGVILSYKNYWSNIDGVVNEFPIYNINSRVLLILPLHHVFPFAGSILAPIYAGATIYVIENLMPETIMRTLQEGRITSMIGVPRLYESFAKGIMGKINASLPAKLIYKLASAIGSQKFSRLVFKSVHEKFGGHMEYFVSGGAALPIETGKIFKALGFYVLEGFGMTECAPMIAFTRPGEWKIGYCGRALRGAEVRIEENGEVSVRGNNVMLGYYNRPEETAQIMRGGWLHTGDTGILHPKYGVKITGRIKEIIVTSNGKNINPVEIENSITQTSVAIKELAVFLHEDVLQAIIFPDMNTVRSNTGITIEDTVRPEIEEYNRNAMSYKRIKRFHIVSHELPKTRLSKIQRFKLHELINLDKKVVEKEDLSNRNETYLILKQLIDDETGMDAKANDHLEIDLSLDSLGRISLIASIEEKFGVEIKETEFDALSTLEILSQYVEKNSSEIKESSVSWKEIFEHSDPNVKLPKSGCLHWFLHNFIKTVFHIFYNYKSSGKDNIPNTPCIFVANHVSTYDGVFVSSKLRWSTMKKTFFFAKDKHFKSSVSQFVAKRNNIILMDINSNVRSSLQQMYQVLKKGNSIIIFPEGTRSKSGEMKDFKDSFAILSQALNIPVVPVAIEGAESTNKMAIPNSFSRIKIHFLAANYPSINQTAKEFKEQVSAIIAKTLKAASKK